jgi:aldehyde:ferredoxin oxidoreductase
MLNAYFKARGWSSDGVPTRKKLTELELEGVAENVGAE